MQAIQTIVATYVRFGNETALIALKNQRLKLLAGSDKQNPMFAKLREQCIEEIEVIDAGIRELHPPEPPAPRAPEPASVPLPAAARTEDQALPALPDPRGLSQKSEHPPTSAENPLTPYKASLTTSERSEPAPASVAPMPASLPAASRAPAVTVNVAFSALASEALSVLASIDAFSPISEASPAPEPESAPPEMLHELSAAVQTPSPAKDLTAAFASNGALPVFTSSLLAASVLSRVPSDGSDMAKSLIQLQRSLEKRMKTRD